MRNPTCPDCHKKWIEGWNATEGEFLYCPSCGQHEKDAQRRAAAGKVALTLNKQAKSQEEILQEILQDPKCRYIWDLTTKIAQDIGVDIHIVFRNRQGAECSKIKQGYQITFGYPELNFCFVEGYQESPRSFQYLWRSKEMTGLEGLWALALHECAHILQTEEETRRRGEMHTQCWAENVKMLQGLYPFVA
jgi:hypothetical protein